MMRIASVEPGSAAWQAGVRAGWKVSDIEGKKDPYFDDLKRTVALSGEGRVISFQFEALPGAREATKPAALSFAIISASP